jgi:exodeoxyribonuclease V alpha subunit
MNIEHVNQVIQISRTRAMGFATVDLVNKDGSIRKRDRTTVVHFPEDAQGAATAGSLWEVSGKEQANNFKVNDTWIFEYTIEPNQLRYLRPSGQVLARWLSTNIKGVGRVIANRLVRLPNLNQLIKNRDRNQLLAVAGMSGDRVDRLINDWPDDSLHEAIEWLESQQLPLGLGAKLVSIFGDDCIAKVKEYPLLLVSMGVPFETAMRLVERLGLSVLDYRILGGIAQHIAIQHATNTGSTVICERDLISGVTKIIKSDVTEATGHLACQQGLLAEVPGGYQVFGTALMELAVAQFLAASYCRKPGESSLLAAWETTLTSDAVSSALQTYEAAIEFSLNSEQKAAVIGAVMSPVCCISGGAGTGKTTILRSILGVYDIVSDGLACYQLALSGRAAQRLAEATGKPAQTIAKFLVDHLGEAKPNLQSHLLIVVDEASMVDLLSMYRLIGVLPPATRFLFVGDTMQLPPVGAGLVFHALNQTQIPFFNLSHVQRQKEHSGIHRFAASLRKSLVELPPKTSGSLKESSDCSFEANVSIERLIELWREAGGVEKCVVLSPMRKGELGVDSLNIALQQSFDCNRPVLHYQDPGRGWIPLETQSGAQLHEGDAVLITENHYVEGADVRNGDLGILSHVREKPGADGSIGMLEINGRVVTIMVNLVGKLELGYAITIHKAQGSQWHTCFVVLPREANRMIDQQLLYTAVTRPAERLVLMGDAEVISKAVKRGSKSSSRRTCLRQRLISVMD